MRIRRGEEELRTEEYVLEDDGLLGEAQEIAIVRFVNGSGGGGLLFDPCPG